MLNFSRQAAGVVSRSWLRRTQGASLYTTVHMWVPTRLRGKCSGHSKSRNLASSTGSLFAETEPRKIMETPHVSISDPLPYSHTVTIPASTFPRRHSHGPYLSVWTILMRVCCLWACAVCVCECARICECACWNLEELP